MKFTSEDLMKAMGLKVGDKIEVKQGALKATFEVSKDFTLLRFDNNVSYSLWNILNLDYKLLPQPKRVGDLKCEKLCEQCPLRALESCNMFGRITLYEALDKVYNDWVNKDQEIYDLLKARLDKEVKDNDSKSI